MLLTSMDVDLECESIAWLSGDERSRCCARRASWPALAWFGAWSSIGWSQSEIDLVRRLAVECRVGTMLVVPSKVGRKFPAKRCSALWHKNPSRNFFLHRSDEAFNHGNAPMLPNGAEPWTNFLASAPAFEVVAPEDGVLVADQVLGRNFDESYGPTKEPAYGE